jgi:hypothetical protein
MNYTFIKRLFIGLAIGFFTVSTIFTVGCTAKRVKVVHKKEGNSGYSEVGHKHKKKGPPPHAPAHGYRAKYQYRYYPSCSVYYDYGRKIYFYIKGDHWKVGASLPNSIHVRLGGYVNMELDTDRPYVYHAEHVKKYPPRQMKNKKGGPPSHAPAYGYRAKHNYRYYPSCSVYYDTGRRLYFYLKGNRWEVGASLPSGLRGRLGGSVSIELDTDKPYVHHAEHVKKYPPGQLKNKKKKKNKWG